MTRNAIRVLTVSVALAVLVATLALPVISATPVAAQDAGNDATTTTTSMTTTATQTTETQTQETAETQTTTASQACEPTDSEPKLSQSRLYAPDTTIEQGSPGRVEGGFQVDPTSACPVVVYITMRVPSGMSIEGSSDITSAGAGMVSTQFVVRPGANVKDIAADVYSNEAGQRAVTADIQYWPEGHKGMSREIDGLSFTFDVEEPHTATETDAGGSESDGSSDEEDDLVVNTPGFGLGTALTALFGVALLFRRL